jgi:hypothetical protein
LQYNFDFGQRGDATAVIAASIATAANAAARTHPFIGDLDLQLSSPESKVAVTEEAWGQFRSPEQERTTASGSQYQRTGKEAAG